MASSDPCSVKVALRVRPLVTSEISKGCKDIVEVIPENEQIVIRNSDKTFTFNYVLGQNSPQDELYKKCVQPLLHSLYQGFNVTIFAYGQTGSGKTFTMGTTYSGEGDMGVIPRTVNDIFFFIRDNFSIDYTVTVSFTELYQEVLFDLLSNKPRDQCTLEIREDQHKEMFIPGLTEITAESASKVLEILAKGSSGRATSATAMNAQSSRSHAIFTLKMCIQNKQDCNQNKTAKLQFIDLAGSERPKKTGAVGNTFKEGVNINKGLLVLGNVISALGDEKTQNGHIPYRDSNLTRLLKDSLGGNSMTLMIACVSPADYNLDETISTLRYADRARKIKNKPIVNQDPKAAEISQLKKKIKELQLQIIGQGGPSICPAEIELKNCEIEQCKTKIRDLSTQLSCAILEKTGLHEKIILLQSANEALNNKLQELKVQYDITFQNINIGFEKNDAEYIKENLTKLGELQKQFVEINMQQKQSEAQIRHYEETFTHIIHASPSNPAETPVEIHEKQESHTTRQLVLNSELQEISKKLLLKEQLASQLALNTNNMVDNNTMSELEAKIAALQQERDLLSQQLKNLQTQENRKMAEQKRKALQEMEQQISNMKKQISEQSRLIKIKERDLKRVDQLNIEITQMKQQKVKLVKLMREENDKYRQWRIQKDRELQKVKIQDQKKQTEIVRMKVQHEKQKVCLKRKVEAAEALNKRLKDQLTLRKQAQDAKMSGKVERLGPWLKHEFEVFVSLIEAEATLTSLLEDRGILQQQLDELKSNPETADSPDARALEEDIELRSVQISDLQQKLLDSDEDNKSKTRFDNIQTMGEAKFALKTIFDETAELQKEKVQLKTKLEEIQESNKELLTKIEETKNMVKDSEENYQDQLSQIQKVHEEKISILLRQLRSSKTEESESDVDNELREICSIQEEKIESLEGTIEHLKEEVQKKEQLCQNILAEVEELKYQKRASPFAVSSNGATPQLNSTFSVDQTKQEQSDVPHVPIIEVIDEDVAPVTPDTVVPKRKKHQSANRRLNSFALDDSIEVQSDNDKEDPDWKRTPLGKRIEKEKRLRISMLNPAALYTNPTNSTIKRSSEGGCTCKKKCSQRCGCKKTSRSCTSACKCSITECLNRDDTVSSTENVDPILTDSTEDSQDNDANATFKRPRENSNQDIKENRHRLRARRKLFDKLLES